MLSIVEEDEKYIIAIKGKTPIDIMSELSALVLEVTERAAEGIGGDATQDSLIEDLMQSFKLKKLTDSGMNVLEAYKVLTGNEPPAEAVKEFNKSIKEKINVKN